MILILASIFMLIDHAGLLLFPEFPVMRFIGRLAFPLFAYQCAISIAKTSSLDHYFMRLMTAAALFQLPFLYVFGSNSYNVVFSFAFSALVVILLKENKYVGFLVYLAVCCFAYFMQVEYGYIGITSVLLFYFTRHDLLLSASGFMFLALVALTFENNTGYFAAFLALPILFSIDTLKRVRMPRYFFYVFYPGHLLVLKLVRGLL